MSTFALKLIAVISMLIDHGGYILCLCGLTDGSTYTLLRALGRPSFIIFCFLIVIGSEKTHDAKRYFSRLTLFALISQIPFTLAFSFSNYNFGTYPLSALNFEMPDALTLLLSVFIAAVYFFLVCGHRFDTSFIWLLLALILPHVRLNLWGYVLLSGNMSVFYTLAVSLALIITTDHFITACKKHDNLVKNSLLLLAALSAVYIFRNSCDYGYKGFVLIFALWLFRSNRNLQVIAAIIWCIVLYWFSYHQLMYTVLAIFGALLLLAYNGKRGANMRGFYYVYPVHLLIFSLLGIMVTH
jgi:hypothetical protein